MKTSLSTSIRVLALCAAAGPWSPARADDVLVNLSKPDGYVFRAVSATLADDTQLADVLAIADYDAAAKAFVFDTARQGAMRVPAADIKEIVFTQALHRSSPQAQACPFTVTARRTPTTRVDVPGDALRIENGALRIDGGRLAPSPLGAGAVVEAQRMTYDRAKRSFAVFVQGVKYERQQEQCGGTRSGGQQKGLQ